MGMFKIMFCKHEYLLIRTIHGDEALYARSEWKCNKCGHNRYSQYLERKQGDA
ncbi:hypothetical protein SESI111939_10070 [Serratia silvae]